MLLYSLQSVFFQTISSASRGEQGVSITPESEVKIREEWAFKDICGWQPEPGPRASADKSSNYWTDILSTQLCPCASAQSHSHTWGRVLTFHVKQRNIWDQWANRWQGLKRQLLWKKIFSLNSAISDINIVFHIIFPISKEFIICEHLQNAWCWGLLKM